MAGLPFPVLFTFAVITAVAAETAEKNGKIYGAIFYGNLKVL